MAERHIHRVLSHSRKWAIWKKNNLQRISSFCVIVSECVCICHSHTAQRLSHAGLRKILKLFFLFLRAWRVLSPSMIWFLLLFFTKSHGVGHENPKIEYCWMPLKVSILYIGATCRKTRPSSTFLFVYVDSVCINFICARKNNTSNVFALSTMSFRIAKFLATNCSRTQKFRRSIENAVTNTLDAHIWVHITQTRMCVDTRKFPS